MKAIGVNISCVIVCYRPDVTRVLRLSDVLREEGASVIFVDNSEVPAFDPQSLPDDVHLLTVGYNSGIARAQNTGIAYAREIGAEAVAFFDQDSRITLGFVSALIDSIDMSAAEVVAPVCVDDISGELLPSERIGPRGQLTLTKRPTSLDRYPVDVVISSGKLVTACVFDLVGGFDEEFFIDYVDTEWCLRCRSKGISIYVAPRAVMRHSIGNKSVRLGPLTIQVHSAVRCYHQIRNAFLLFRKPHVPFMYALRQLVSICGGRLLLLAYVDNRISYLRMYASAVVDGLRSVVRRKPG